MTKKKKVYVETVEAAPAEAEPPATVVEEVPKVDPVLLGVTLPMAVTRTALEQLATAWGACGSAMLAALKAKVSSRNDSAEPTLADGEPSATA